MAKLMDIIRNDGVTTNRVPHVPGSGNYNQKHHIGEHERQQFLEGILPGVDYIEFKALGKTAQSREDSLEWIKRIVRSGPIGPLRGIPGRRFVFLDGHWTDKGSVIMVDEESGYRALDDAGIHVMDPAKAPKYKKRLYAHYAFARFGTIVDVTETDEGQLTEFQLHKDGPIYTWFNYNLDLLDPKDVAVCDGIGLVKPEFLKVLNVKARNYEVWGGKYTAFGPVGLGKGYLHAKSGLKFDIVSYGAKTAIRFDSFFFGILGDLKPGQLYYSDLQSDVNMELFEFLVNGATKLRHEIGEYMLSPSQVLKIVAKYVNMGRVDPDDVPSSTSWAFIRALLLGVSIHAEPSLFRTLYNQLLFEVMQCERGRVPLDFMGIRGDIMPDLNMFDDYGVINRNNTLIPEGCMVMLDAPQGPTVEYRQPNGMALEQSRSMNMHMRQFQKYAGERRCICGADLYDTLKPKNGADLDDTQCVVFDPAAVKHLRSLTYPVTHKIQVRDVVRKKRSFTYDQLTRRVEGADVTYTVQDFIAVCDEAETRNIQLGQWVNTIMLDTALSGRHKVHMMEYLATLIQNEPDKERKIFLLNCREWLAQRQDYMLRHIATNLEAVIDFCIQGKGDPVQFAEWIILIDKVRLQSRVFPFFFAKEGTGFMKRGRISTTLEEGKDFVLAPSLLCEVLSKIEADRKDFLDALRHYEWNCITPVPLDLDMRFGASMQLRQDAIDLRNWYSPAAIAAMSAPTRDLKRDEYRKVIAELNLRIETITGGNHEYQMALAVQLKRLVSRRTTPQLDEQGLFKQVPVGIFANPIVFNYYLDAIEEVGIGGKYVFVELERKAVHLRDENVTVVVDDRGNVLRKSDGFFIGFADANSGEYLMIAGLLEVKKPHPDLLGYAERAELVEKGELEIGQADYLPGDLSGEEDQ